MAGKRSIMSKTGISWPTSILSHPLRMERVKKNISIGDLMEVVWRAGKKNSKEICERMGKRNGVWKWGNGQ